jgi:hypothetical protein
MFARLLTAAMEPQPKEGYYVHPAISCRIAEHPCRRESAVLSCGTDACTASCALHMHNPVHAVAARIKTGE